MKVRGKFVSKFGPDLMPIYAVNGLQITHVNLFSINYGGQIRDIFQGNLVVDLVVDFGGHLRCKWPQFHSREFIFNKLWDVIWERFAGRFGSHFQAKIGQASPLLF